MYTCGLAYLVSTALSQVPLASVLIYGFIATAPIAALFIVIRRRRPRGQSSVRPGMLGSQP